MARPQKEGLEYFPLDVDIDQDDKLVVPIAKHGMLGLGVIVKLMMEVYKNGYYYPWTEKELYVFPFKIGVETEKVSEIVIDCINSGFFCINQYKRNQILTSYGFQKRFLLATTRRKDATINDRYLVQKELMSTETELMHTETKESTAISTQSKVKEIESKEKVKERDTTTSDSFISILEEYCKLHNKPDYQVVATDRALIYELLESIKPEFIINTMTSIHKRTTKKIHTFSYYSEAIKESWKGVTEGETSRSNVRPFRNTGTSNTISDDEFDELLELQRAAMQNL